MFHSHDPIIVFQFYPLVIMFVTLLAVGDWVRDNADAVSK